MQLSTIQSRINNTKDRIERKAKTIAGKTKLLDKKKKQITDAGYDLSDREAARENMQIFWLFFDIENLEDDLRRLPKEIDELKKTLSNYEEQLTDVQAEGSCYADEVPECLKALERELINKWTSFDISRRDQIKNNRSQLPWKDFIKKYTKYEINDLIYKTDSDIEKNNEKDAKYFVLNLYNRIKDITGEVTDWSGVALAPGTRGSATLNGIVAGTKGRCKVESIYAEGPVQRLHVRVLTKELN